MSTINGQLKICDRCGNKVFLACTGEGERDGGYTRWNTFEPLPEGWSNHWEVGLLCPKCRAQWLRIVDKFNTGADLIEESEM